MPFLDDLIGRLRMDTTDVDRAAKDVPAKLGGAAQQASAATVPATSAMAAGYRGAASAALGMANAVGGLTGTTNRAVTTFQMVAIQTATMGDALSRTGGAIGAVGLAFNRAFPILALVGGAVTVAVAAWNALTSAKEKNREETDKTIDAKKKLIAKVREEKTALAEQSAVQDRVRELVNQGVKLEVARTLAVKRAREEGKLVLEGIAQEKEHRAELAEKLAAEAKARREAAAAAREEREAAAEAAFERARSQIVGLPEEVTPEQDIAAVRARASEMHRQSIAEDLALEQQAESIRAEMRETERQRIDERIADKQREQEAWRKAIQAEAVAGTQAIGALALQAFLARKSFGEFAQSVAQLFLTKALMYEIEAGVLYAAAAIPSIATPGLLLQATQSAQIGAGYAAAAGIFAGLGGGIGRAPSGVSAGRGGGSVGVRGPGGGGVGIGFGGGGRPGFGGGGGPQTVIFNIGTIAPGATPEDVGAVIARNLDAYYRDRNIARRAS